MSPISFQIFDDHWPKQIKKEKELKVWLDEILIEQPTFPVYRPLEFKPNRANLDWVGDGIARAIDSLDPLSAFLDNELIDYLYSLYLYSSPQIGVLPMFESLKSFVDWHSSIWGVDGLKS